MRRQVAAGGLGKLISPAGQELHLATLLILTRRRTTAWLSLAHGVVAGRQGNTGMRRASPPEGQTPPPADYSWDS
jgi:hypothetical protein